VRFGSRSSPWRGSVGASLHICRTNGGVRESKGGGKELGGKWNRVSLVVATMPGEMGRHEEGEDGGKERAKKTMTEKRRPIWDVVC
jgi:hypothetical protein